MSDNVNAPIPSGTTLATKDLGGGVHATKNVQVDASGALIDSSSSGSAAAITLGATFAAVRGIYVGVTGDVVATIGGTDITFKNAPAGSILPVKATRVVASGTTATNLVGLA